MRTEPPPSLPWDRAERPATCPAAAPPLDPPGVREVSQGLRHGSPSRFSVEPLCPSSGVLVLPRIMAPDFLMRSVTRSSASGTMVFEDEGAVGGTDALGGVEVFNGNWHSMEGSQGVAPMHGGLGLSSPLHGHVSHHREVGV